MQSDVTMRGRANSEDMWHNGTVGFRCGTPVGLCNMEQAGQNCLKPSRVAIITRSGDIHRDPDGGVASIRFN